MTASVLPGLVVDVEARIDKLEKALARANVAQRKSSDQMERRAKQSADKLTATYAKSGESVLAHFKKLGPAFAGGLLAGGLTAAIEGTLSKVGDIAKGIAEVGDEAKRAGVSAKSFQEWKFVAEQNRIGVDALTDGLKELNLRADEFIVTGKGSAAEAFARLGYRADELKKKLKDPSNLMLEIIERLERVDKAAQIRISDELFGGTGGEQFVQLISQGEAGLRATIQKAHDAGAVLDDELIQRAAELDRRFGEVKTKVGNLFKSAVIDAATLVGLVDRIATAPAFDKLQTARVFGDGLADALDKAGAVSEDTRYLIGSAVQEFEMLADEASTTALQINDAALAMDGLGKTDAANFLRDVSRQMSEAVGEFRKGSTTGDDMRKALADVTTEAGNSISELGELDQARLAGVTDAVATLLGVIGSIPAQVQAARAAIVDLNNLGGYAPDLNRFGPITGETLSTDNAPKSSPRPRSAPALIGEPDKGSKGGSGGGRSTDEYQRAVEGINREITALEAEAVALAGAASAGKGYGDVLEFAKKRAQLLTAAQREGKTITPELAAEIDKLAQSYAVAGAQADEAEKRLKKMQDAGKAGAEAISDIFVSVLDGSKSAGEALKDLLLEMLKVQLQQRIMGMFTGGGFLGTIGSLLGFAAGGWTGPGGRLEPAGVVHRGEFVMSKEATDRLGVANLDALHRAALTGYASGGFVTAGKRSLARSGGAGTGDQIFNISAPVTVNGSAGTPEQNADLADKVARELEGSMRGVVVDELRRQMRPGALIGNLRHGG